METGIIKIIVLLNNQVLVSQIEEVGSDIGEPDCKLIRPYLIKENQLVEDQKIYEPWNSEYTSDDTFMISSDKIVTIADPRPTILEKYTLLIK